MAHKYLDGKVWPKVADAPEPSLIVWNNIGVSTLQKLIRVLVNYIISTIIVVISFMLI